MLQVPPVQTWIAKRAVNSLETKINGTISIDRIAIVFFNRVMAKDAYVRGEEGDTLACFKKLSVTFSARDLIQGKIKFNRVIIEDGCFFYAKEGEKGKSNLSRIFNVKKDPNKKSKGVPDLSVADVRLKNFNFRYRNPFGRRVNTDPECMDYTYIDVTGINAKINNLKTTSNVLTCRIRELSAKEKSGLTLKSLKGDFTLGPKESRLDNMRLIEEFSDVTAKYLSFKYDSSEELSDFTNKVNISADFRNAILDFRTLARFAPSLKNSKLKIIIQGEVAGPVVDLRSANLKVSSPSGNTSIRLATIFKGLPDINKVNFNLLIRDLRTMTPDLAHMIASFDSSEPLEVLLSLPPSTQYRYNGLIIGSFTDLIAQGSMSSDVGMVRHDITFKNNGKMGGVILNGNVSTSNLDIGSILDIPSLGRANVDTYVRTNLKSKEYGGPTVNLDSLRIRKLAFNGYEYSNIFANGKLEDNSFDGRVICHDPNLDFLFQGLVSFPSDDNPSKYNIYLDIPFADPSALKLDLSEAITDVSLKMLANFAVDQDDKLLGEAEMRNLAITNKNGVYNVNSIRLNSLFQNNKYIMGFDSPFLTAELNCDNSPSILISRLKDILLYGHFGDVFVKKGDGDEKEDNAGPTPGDCKVSLLTLNTKPLFDIFFPGLYVADSTHIELNLSQDNDLDFKIKSQRLAVKSNYIKNLDLSLSNPDSLLKCDITSTHMSVIGLNIDSNYVNIVSDDGIINLSYLFCNDSDKKNEMEFSSDIFFSRDTAGNLQTNVYVNESELFIHGYRWGFSPSDIIIGKGLYKLDGFRLYNQEQEIKIDGLISHDPSSILKMDMNNFDVSIINSFIQNDFNIQGMFTGDLSIKDFFGSTNILMDILGKDVYLFEREIGDLSLMSKWDQGNQRMNLRINNVYRGGNPLNIIGYYHPKRNYLYANVSLKDFALTYIDPFISRYVNINSGSITGDVILMGPLDKLVLTSDNSKFDNLAFTPVFTKVPYIMNGGINLSQSGVTFNNIEIKDPKGNTAILSGGMAHSFFKDIHMDTKLTFDKLQCLNTTWKDNSTFYGTASGSGSATITGPLNDLALDATFATGENTAIHVPLSGASSASSKELLTFTSKPDSVKTDPYDSLMNVMKTRSDKRKSSFKLHARANVAPDAEVFVEINKEVGDILSCKGSGTVDLTLNPSKDIFDLRGDYTVAEGHYHLVLLGIISKDFTIKEGGTISFNGGLRNTNMDIGAVYRTKAAVSTLISDTSSVGIRKNVECGINMKGPLSNPEISFNIDIPDLDPITKGRVESALSTADKVQKQFMALMISGSFVPDEQSSIVNNSTMLYSNASEILSNQFNNVFRQLGVPLDLGLNYQPGQGKKDLFDVAVSYQAFDNRLILNGSVGNSQTSSNWAGNFDAEVKMDRRGKFRFTLFTRAADQYTNYLDNTQRSGFGFIFQDEFNSFREIFMGRKRKEEYETMKLLEAEEELKKEAEKMNIKKETILKPKEDPMKNNVDVGSMQYNK